MAAQQATVGGARCRRKSATRAPVFGASCSAPEVVKVCECFKPAYAQPGKFRAG
jgi:hypothetical protein